MTATALTRRPRSGSPTRSRRRVAAAIAWRLFPLAIPLVDLDIRLARAESIAQAEAIAASRRSRRAMRARAARFAHDESAQNYVELEGGGKSAFAALVAGDVYSPYWWEVRLFAPGEPTEATVRFRPDGAPIGFARRLPETFVPADPAGLALDRSCGAGARRARARADWGVDFGAYRLLEATQQTRTTGRVDHAFVYERTRRAHLADSRFRLRLAVAGNVLTEVTPFVYVPESFDRRFRELRSANNAIAGAASIAAARPLRHRRLRVRRAVARAQALAAVAARGGGGFAVGALLGATIARGRADRVVRLRHRAVGRRPSGCARSARRPAITFAGGLAAGRSSSWRPRACRGARFRRIRSSGACGRARPRRRGRCSAARSAAICSCRSRSR